MPEKFFNLQLYTYFSSDAIWSTKKVKFRKLSSTVIFINPLFLSTGSGDKHFKVFCENDISFHSDVIFVTYYISNLDHLWISSLVLEIETPGLNWKCEEKYITKEKLCSFNQK